MKQVIENDFPDLTPIYITKPCEPAGSSRNDIALRYNHSVQTADARKVNPYKLASTLPRLKKFESSETTKKNQMS